LRPTQVITKLVSMENVRVALGRAMEEAPGSVRELARAAGLDHAALVRVRDGEYNLTPARVRSVIAALREWGRRCTDLADELEAALDVDEEHSERRAGHHG